MKLLVKRVAKESAYTIGKLYINGEYFCDTLEDKDRGLKQSNSLSDIQRIKVKDETAIPSGTYEVTLNVVSPKFGSKPFYNEVCGGRLPRLLNVPGFDGILIHVGDGPRGAGLSSGCLLIGKNLIPGQLSNGKETFKALYKELLKDKSNITITIE